MPLLDKHAFAKTWTGKMVRIGEDAPPPFDFWPYVEQIAAADYAGFDCSEGNVEWAWRTSDGKFEHVLISTKEDKTFQWSSFWIARRAKSSVIICST